MFLSLENNIHVACENKHSGLFCSIVNDENSFIRSTFVSFNNNNYACKPGTNTLAYVDLLSMEKKFLSHKLFLA
jgi:hypothetical protein